jgi:uncharacterized repeat protein (TIGR03843 family)
MQSSKAKKEILSVLQQAPLTVEGQFVQGSNYTFLAKLEHQDQEMTVVYKPMRGEQPLWDFPHGSLSRREVAAFLVSEALRWELVPPTVFRRKAPLGPGSVQLYIEHDPEYHYFSFNPEDRERLRPVALFDLVINNADRKGGHIFFDRDDHLWLIDHGICFHSEDKLRTVVWDFAGMPFTEDCIARLIDFLNRLNSTEDNLQALLEGLLTPLEVQALANRIKTLLLNPIFPHPAANRRPYPWPPV